MVDIYKGNYKLGELGCYTARGLMYAIIERNINLPVFTGSFFYYRP